MKAHTIDKKWIMTGALLAVLGLNLSFKTLDQKGYSSLEFASTEQRVESKIKTEHGEMPVEYVDGGDSKILAFFPKKMTEGKVCEICGYDSMSMKATDLKNVDALNAEMQKALTKADLTPIDKDSTVEVEEGDDKPAKLNPFDKIAKQCDRRSDDRSEVLECMKEKFLSAITGSKGKKLDPDDALSFYKKEIQSRLLQEMTEARRIASRARRSATSQSAFMSFTGSEDGERDPNEMINGGLKIIEDLLSDTPERFESVRRNLLQAETEILKHQAAEVKQVQAQAKANIGTSEGVFLTTESTTLLGQLEAMRQQLGSKTYGALADAGANGHISYELESQYKKIYNDFNSQLVSAMNNQSSFLDGVMTTGGIDLSQRINMPGRGQQTVIVQQPSVINGVSNRGANLVTTQTGATFVQVQDATGRTVMIPTSNNNIEFGTATPATEELLRLRAGIPRQ